MSPFLQRVLELPQDAWGWLISGYEVVRDFTIANWHSAVATWEWLAPKIEHAHHAMHPYFTAADWIAAIALVALVLFFFVYKRDGKKAFNNKYVRATQIFQHVLHALHMASPLALVVAILAMFGGHPHGDDHPPPPPPPERSA